ncbi:MAG: nucleoside 2-deoxyribosyltransferase domain-containing protein [Nanoarchaeota archaeon]|nr:nucleoside 2-deoxyribosyltransferase domain-containing protein [Nanoarchaeota archaeon]
MGKLILPKTYIENIDDALIFLAGPIKGAPLWQDKAIELIHSQDPNIYIISPSKEIREEYLNNKLKGSENKFSTQLDWERYYLDLSLKKGVILFWLPKQKENCNKAYARDTLGELGELRGRLIYNKNIKLVIGGEEDFDGFDVIKRNYFAISPEMKFYSTLKETCQQAVKLTYPNNK